MIVTGENLGSQVSSTNILHSQLLAIKFAKTFVANILIAISPTLCLARILDNTVIQRPAAGTCGRSGAEQIDSHM